MVNNSNNKGILENIELDISKKKFERLFLLFILITKDLICS